MQVFNAPAGRNATINGGVIDGEVKVPVGPIPSWQTKSQPDEDESSKGEDMEDYGGALISPFIKI